LKAGGELQSIRRTGPYAALVITLACLAAPPATQAITLESPEPAAEGLSAYSLIPPAVDLLLQGEGARAARLARRSDPRRVQQRQASRSNFENLTPAQTLAVARKAFPALEQPSSGLPQLAPGQHVLAYPTDHAAEVSLPGGKGLIESLAPIAGTTAHRTHVPFDLRLSSTGDGRFAPARPDVAVQVPSDLARGVVLTDVGVSLTPVNRRGTAIAASAGVLNGAAVQWTARDGHDDPVNDVSTLATASLRGFELTSMLLSQRSPSELYFHVGIPAGAHMQSAPDGSVRILRRGGVIAEIAPPSAQDAEGTSIPVTMHTRGDQVELKLHLAGDYLYPIAVDPEVNDGQLATTSAGKRSNWEFSTSNGSRFAGSAVYEGSQEHLETRGIAEYAPGEVAYWGYQTKGDSKIYEVKTETSARNKGAKIESFLEFEQPGGAQETKSVLSTEAVNAEYDKKVVTLCAANAGHEECLPAAGKEKNAVHFQQSAGGAPGGNYHFWDTMSQGIVSISEPTGTHSTTSYNTTSPSLEFEAEFEGKKEKVKRINALYGSGSWLTKLGGAVEMIAKDPGIGVAATKLEYQTGAGKWSQLFEHKYLEVEHACKGVQCYEAHSEYLTLPPGLPDGEDTLRYRAEEAIAGTQSLESEGKVAVKVDTKAPRALQIAGLPFGNELSERAYQLTASATDGEGTTIASSGVKSIALYVDGHAFGAPAGSCSVAKGECTATAKWSVNGAELGSGHHDIKLVAIDNAGNEATFYQPVTIRHSTPVKLGPGSLDLESGNFSLGASDVSLGAGLTVGRDYNSRNLVDGNRGPLGPQWNLSLSNAESLIELVDGGVLMTASNGGQTIFSPLGEGKFESPTGDSNLQLTLEENKTTKTKLAYYLKNAAAGTSVKFTMPPGTTSAWVPTKQEGTAPTDTVAYSYQAGKYVEYGDGSNTIPREMTTGPEGDIWFISEETHKIAKINPNGGAVTEYGTGDATGPTSLTAGPDGNIWFTSSATGEISKMTPSGTVTDMGHVAETPSAITSGPDGKLWFVERAANKIANITTSGVITTYTLPSGSFPSKIVAGPDGNVWFTEYYTSKVAKITPAGAITEYSLPTESWPYGITTGADGDLWFTEMGSQKIAKITTSGAITEYGLGGDPVGYTPLIEGADGDVWFEEGGWDKVAKMTTSGALTEYPMPSKAYPETIAPGPEGNIWVGDYNKNFIVVPTSGPPTEPTEELAAKPAGVSCEPELNPGCRALKFRYSTATTASGEGASQWGEFQTRLKEVLLDAYDPASKGMREVAVAKYSYDAGGRLRAEWDPRVSPALKTTYGYDESGHVTALSPPGQEPWTFTYGTGAGDGGNGRLLKLTRAPATSELWGGEPITNSEVPHISGTPTVGARLAVSNGKWTNVPLTYGYQWEDCNTTGGGCAPILGADNANYTVTSHDAGHSLAVAVTASNAGGAATASTSASAEAKAPQISEYALPASSRPTNITTGPDGNLWFTENGSSKVAKITTAGTLTEYGPVQTTPQGIANGPDGYLWFTDSTPSAGVDRISTTGEETPHSLPSGSSPFGIATGPDGNLWFTRTSAGAADIAKMTPKGTILAEYALPSNGTLREIVTGPDNNIWFTEYGASKIGKVEIATGKVTEYPLPAGSGPWGIAVGADGNLWFTDFESSKVGKITTGGAITEYALPAGSSPRGIATGPEGDLWVAESENSALAKVTTTGAITEYPLAAGSQPYDVTLGPDNNLWISERGTGTSKILKFASVPDAELKPPGPGVTINYGVPTTGTGAPHDMSATAVAGWGQQDDPVEATAITAADEPQGWPAGSYKRATVYYLDEHGRQVNVANPSNATYGSITTSEYNEFNDVIRTLTPDNRATALAAGASSAEVSKLLDTQSTYNGEGKKEGEVSEPGTRLIDTLGPQHKIAYVAGKEQKEALARDHTQFVYDQGAPVGETYNLLTEEFELAQLANHEEVEVRTTKKSYSGQGNLGWKLRAPTSVTVDPEGLNLTTTTAYNAATAQITEVRGAGAEQTLSYTTKFGEAGTEAGKLKSPWGAAINAEGKLWVVDTANNRVEEFGPEGTYIAKLGEAGSGNGQLKEPEGIALDAAGHIWVADTGNNRVEEFSATGAFMTTVGSLGSESGKFHAPAALAFDTKGNMWVADSANNRIEKFDKESKYAAEFGSAGAEPGKLSEPRGIAVDAGEHVWVADTANNRIQEFSTSGTPLKHFGTPGSGEGQLNKPIDLKIDSAGDIWTVDSLNARAESFSPNGAYITQIGWKGTGQGQLSEPHGLAFDASGKVWIADSSNNRMEQWAKGPNARDERSIYYGAEANGEGFAACGAHPEWSGLVCETLPAKQPELMGLPKLPVTSYTYNMYNEPETITETFGETTRTKKEAYDAAGRRSSSETTASTGTALPKITFEYNKEQGALEKEVASGEAKTLATEYNRLGEPIKYSDADGNIAKFKYAGPEGGSVLEEVADSSNGATSKQSYSYDKTTMQRTQLIDSSAGTFTASYDAEGELTSVDYPYNMCADYVYNSVGETTSVRYLKSSNCAESEPALWYSDTRSPSIHGEMFNQSSSVATDTYTYDIGGRLTETQETPAGEGCTVRAYAYDEAGDRTSASSRIPGTGGACQGEGGTIEAHNYDEAGRLADGGIGYDGLGNITKLPAADAEGHELTSSFYADNAVASQTQNGVSNSYALDPEGRVRATTTGSTTTISHYDGSGEAVAWTESPGKWTRNIPGIDGTLAATQTNGETPIVQLHDLQGNVVGTIGDKAGETKLISTYNSTEFGVPNAGKAPPKFAWMGASGVESSLSSGVITFGASSYVPQTGRALQSESVEAPGVAGGSGAGAPYTVQEEPWNMQGAAREGAEAPGFEAVREQEAWARSFVDPAVHVTMNRQRAATLARTYWEAESTAVVLSDFDLPGDFTELLGKLTGDALSQFDDAYKWLNDAGNKLSKCAENKRVVNGQAANICWFEYEQDEWEPEIPFTGIHPVGKLTWPNFSVEPTVNECMYVQGPSLVCVANVYVQTEL
jgi:streptogramin lyase